MMRSLLLIMLVAYLTAGYGQKASIELRGALPPSSETVTMAHLLRNDSTIAVQYDGSEYRLTFDSLPPGTYTVKYYINLRLIKQFDNIQLSDTSKLAFYPEGLQQQQFYNPLPDSITQRTGTLHLNVSPMHYDNKQQYTVYVYKGDSMVRYSTVNTTDNVIFDHLQVGEYELRVFSRDRLIVYNTGILIQAGEHTEHELLLYKYEETKKPECPDSTQDHMIICPYIHYSNPELEGKNSPIAGCLSLGYIQEFYSNENKHISPAFAFGLAADVAPFNTEWDTIILKGRSNERYVSGKMIFGFNLHIGTKTLASSSAQKFFFDIGFNYKLPILFHHTASKGTTTAKRYFIHQFTDCAVTTRIGYGEAALSAEYRLFDYLLGNFPELPRFRFGLSFPFKAF